MLRRVETILVKTESTYKTDSNPVTTDAVFINNLQYSTDIRSNERPGVKRTMGPRQSIYGGRTIGLSFETELKGSGTAGVAPECGPLLKACGFSEAIVADTSVTYSPVSNDIESVTIYHYLDGKLRKYLGCRGDVSIENSAGKFGKLNFTFTGHQDSETDASNITPVYDSTIPVAFVNAGLTIGGYSGVLTKVMVSMNNQVSVPEDVNSSNGYGEVRVADRNPEGTIDPEDVLIATKNWYNELETGALLAINGGVIGGTAGNRWQLTQGQCAYRNITENEREGIATLDITYGLLENSGDDQLALVFT